MEACVDVVLDGFCGDLAKRKLAEHWTKVFGGIEVLLVSLLCPEGWF
jgi:hypothetical protein